MKIALIKKEATSFWKSCQSITTNLEKSYEFLCGEKSFDCESFPLSESESSLGLNQLAGKILKEDYSHIAWIDHYPHPQAFITALCEVGDSLQVENFPTIIIHLFGDFLLHVPQWEGVESILEERKEKGKATPNLSFVAASHRQLKLVESFLSEESSLSKGVIAFPVDESQFNFSLEERSKKRQELDLKEEEHLFLYTGRLSYQKNIFDLIRSFVSARKTFGLKAKLFLTGPMDDLGIPYLGKEALPGTFFFHWEECFKTEEYKKLLSDGVIKYLGNLNSNDLRAIYCAADTYVSFSCHNDEDYGMSPAEACACGLQSLLSAWGGFPSFEKYFPNECHTVLTTLDALRQAPSQMVCIKGFGLKSQKVSSHQERENFSQRAIEELGILATSKKIDLHLEKLSGGNLSFNNHFRKLSSILKSQPKAPFKGPAGGYSLFYKEVYKDYVGSLKEEVGHE